MESKALALFLLFNFLFFTYVSATCPTPATPTPASPKPSKKPAKCPKNALKLSACADVLGLLKLGVGGFSSDKCCSLLGGLVDLEAALCLCTAIKANVLGININVPVDLSLLLNTCGKNLPTGYKC